ncbi:unnamed protein product [Leptidea sinapis]|uniref:FHA domain-containing protein n=1 Tax=Leptidea sinapis TaxID=189913 RepID=A0A5E4Q8Z1_9NEOP|nr:unnamed protein product [Leptidea sinapis]
MFLGRGYFAVDFGSKNGTLLNGLRILSMVVCCNLEKPNFCVTFTLVLTPVAIANPDLSWRPKRKRRKWRTLEHVPYKSNTNLSWRD